MINDIGDEKTKVVVLEGWCVGFRALDDMEVEKCWDFAVRQRDREEYRGRLGWNNFENIQYLNEALKRYDEITE